MIRGLMFACCSLVTAQVAAQDQTTWLVSVDEFGAQYGADSTMPMITPDGRFIVFVSGGPLVAGDTNQVNDIYVRDRFLGTVRLVTRGIGGVPANGRSGSPFITPDGRFVLFQSGASNLVTGDTNGRFDVFRRDLVLDTTVRVNVTSTGAQSLGSLDEDGPGYMSLSDDGDTVAFTSSAPDLIVGDTNNNSDVFVHTISDGHTERITVNAQGGQSAGGLYASISADGRYVAFSALDDIFPGDQNNDLDVYVKDTLTGALARCSIASNGQMGNGDSRYPRITADGRVVVFTSEASLWTPLDTNSGPDVYVKNLVTEELELVSVSMDGTSGSGILLAISRDARFVAFNSGGERMAPGADGGSQVYTRDRSAQTTVRSSVGRLGESCSYFNGLASISDDGKVVAYSSACLDFVPHDINGLTRDVFVREQPYPEPFVTVCPLALSACPCPSNGEIDQGCVNSYGEQGSLIAIGLPSVAHDTIQLVASQLGTSTTCLVFQGDALTSGTQGNVLGDGLGCVGENVIRLGTRPVANHGATFGFLASASVAGASDPILDGNSSISRQGRIDAAGSLYFYQAWYRDSSAVHCTPATFNLTNAIQIVWTP